MELHHAVVASRIVDWLIWGISGHIYGAYLGHIWGILGPLVKHWPLSRQSQMSRIGGGYHNLAGWSMGFSTIPTGEYVGCVLGGESLEF